MNAIIAFLLMLFQPSPITEPARTPTPIVQEVDEILSFPKLPKETSTCKDIEVRGSPRDGGMYLYSLKKGTKVRVIEQSRGADRSWIMIGTAEWIPISATDIGCK